MKASVSLKKHFKSQVDAIREILEEREKRYQERYDEQEKALDLANQILHEQRTLFSELNKQVNSLNTSRGENKGNKEGVSAVWTTVIALSSLIIGAIASGLFQHLLIIK